jgi:ethanolamine utilization protein EutQ (cupin superfamily)
MTVYEPDLATAPDEPFGPARIAHWSSRADLDLLGTYSMVFGTTGESDPWTLSYEESIYVIEGSAWVVELGEQERTVRAEAGRLLVIDKGTTVRYGGEAGTRLLLSIAPVHFES